MRIRKIKVNNFKSLVHFDMSFEKFTCLVGLNGSGKSTVLQFVDFLSQLVRKHFDTWLDDRNWVGPELKFQGESSDIITFTVDLIDDSLGEFSWEAEFDINQIRCVKERFQSSTEHLYVGPEGWSTQKRDSEGSQSSDNDFLRSLDFQGSILSVIRAPSLPTSLIPVKEFFLKTHSFELLSPELMRNPGMRSSGSIGPRGEALAAYIFEMDEDKRQRLLERLLVVYPRLRAVESKLLRSGWKQLRIHEQFRTRLLQTDASHINEGFLRLLAIIAELESEHSCLLFDEIENGINPELVPFLVEVLTKTTQQVVVTTHSPLLLNYYADDDAKKSIFYLYKTSDGITNGIRYFDIPSMAEKLRVMGPGEAFADTNLVELADEILTVQEPV